MKPARTRFAPSPTGFLHVGGVRTALFAWLVARQTKGVFILRLEDTDQAREVSGSAEHIIKSLTCLGLNYDEGPDKGGPFGPYRQSERLAIYKEFADQLVKAGRAYADPYSASEVDDLRKAAQANKQPFLYRDHRPESPPEWDGSQPLRFKSEPKAYAWTDAVMGELKSGPEVIDDFILMKSDGFPTYNFAHIIDDHLMGITHVIRSQEFLASAPKYLSLYEALGLKPPIMATVPFVLAPDGRKKLSKRDGAKDVLEYLSDGYLPAALINFMASLGWNDGSTQEVFSLEELIQKFSLNHVQRSGARFDEQRLLWLNGAHIRELELNDLFDRCKAYWPDSTKDSGDEYKKRVLGLVQERLKTLSELGQLTDFFFKDLPVNLDLIKNHPKLSKLDQASLSSLLTQAKTELGLSDFSLNDLNDRLNKLLETTNQPPAVLFSLIRIATTEAPASPGLGETMVVLGKERCLSRIDQLLSAINSH